jgi:hypothetical protein
MTWNDGYDGVFRTSETKEILCLAPLVLSSMLGYCRKQHGHDLLEQSPASLRKEWGERPHITVGCNGRDGKQPTGASDMSPVVMLEGIYDFVLSHR